MHTSNLEDVPVLKPRSGFYVQRISQTLGHLSAGLTNWLADVRRQAPVLPWMIARPVECPPVQAPPPRLDRAREWRMVTEAALRQLARASEMMPLQTQAAIHIDAAEHALNRLIAECAKVGCTVMQPTFAPMRQLVSEPAAQPIRQPMAA